MNFNASLVLTLIQSAMENEYTATIAQTPAKLKELRQITIAEAASDTEINFSDVITSVEELWIISDAPVSVKLNSSANDAIPASKIIILSETTAITKIYISNSSGDTATIDIFAAG